MITLDAVLEADATTAISRAGVVFLTLRAVTAHGPRGTGAAVHAHKVYGTGHAAGYAASRRAQELRRHVRVRLSSAGLDLRRGHIDMGELLDLQTPDIPTLPARWPTKDD